MYALAVAVTSAALAAGGGTTMTGKDAPDLMVGEWIPKVDVNLRNIRGRKALILLYHTAC